jgi:hypothetical protein
LTVRKDTLQSQSILVMYGTRTGAFSLLFSRIAAQTAILFASASESAHTARFESGWRKDNFCYYFWRTDGRTDGSKSVIDGRWAGG